MCISLIQAWWGISVLTAIAARLSIAAGARGIAWGRCGAVADGGGVASAVILGLGWTLLPNGSAIVYCPPSARSLHR
jgi:hypothetical protein